MPKPPFCLALVALVHLTRWYFRFSPPLAKKSFFWIYPSTSESFWAVGA
jgi:hypothetical protein